MSPISLRSRTCQREVKLFWPQPRRSGDHYRPITFLTQRVCLFLAQDMHQIKFSWQPQKANIAKKGSESAAREPSRGNVADIPLLNSRNRLGGVVLCGAILGWRELGRSRILGPVACTTMEPFSYGLSWALNCMSMIERTKLCSIYIPNFK
jgi:hypothetical protein